MEKMDPKGWFVLLITTERRYYKWVKTRQENAMGSEKVKWGALALLFILTNRSG